MIVVLSFILADLLDRLKANEVSIEEVALRLSIQRPNMVGTEDQYILLYRFIDYYLEQKSKSTSYFNLLDYSIFHFG